jgi:hypothetical protein
MYSRRHASFRALPPRRPHQGGLEQNCGSQRAEQRQSHQLPHARHARLVGEPKAATAYGTLSGYMISEAYGRSQAPSKDIP